MGINKVPLLYPPILPLSSSLIASLPVVESLITTVQLLSKNTSENVRQY